MSSNNDVLKGLNEIASVLRCSPEEVRHHAKHNGLPVMRKSETGVYRTTRGLLVGWMENQAIQTTNAMIDSASLANNPSFNEED